MITSRNSDGRVIDWRYHYGVGYEKTISQNRIDRIRQIKQENPDANKRWLAVMSFDSERAVEIALKDYYPEEQLNST
jgi:hypothetical protein